MNNIKLIIICAVVIVTFAFSADLTVYGILVAALIALFFPKGRNFIKSLGFRKQKNWLKTIGLAFVLAAITMYGIGYFVQFLATIFGFTLPSSIFSSDLRGNLALLIYLLISSIIAAGFIEEMIFRGFVLDRLERIYGMTTSRTILIVIITSLFFGIAHVYQGTHAILSTALTSIVFSVIFLKSDRNLWLCVLTHSFHNAIIFIAFYFGWTTG